MNMYAANQKYTQTAGGKNLLLNCCQSKPKNIYTTHFQHLQCWPFRRFALLQFQYPN